MTSKEKNNLKLFFNKVKRVFQKDIMIYHNYYIIGGDDSNDKLDGMVLLIVDDKYKDLLSYVINENNSYYISDIDKFREELDNDVDEYITYEQINDSEFKIPNSYDDESIVETLLSETSNPDVVWTKLSEQNKIAETFFGDKLTYDLPLYDKDGNEVDTIVISKNLFPNISEKNIDSIFYFSQYLEERDLYVTYFDFRYDFYQMLCRFFSIPLK